MLAYAIFAFAIVLFLLLSVVYLYPGSRSRPTTIPGPDPSDPNEGNLPDISLAGGLHNFLSDLHGQFGPILSYWHGTQLMASVASPDGFKEQAHLFDRPSLLFDYLKPLIGEKSLQFTNGVEARNRRQLYDKAFSHQACLDLFPVLNQLTKNMCTKWESIPADQHIPLHQYMIAYAIKAVLTTHFGSYFQTDANILKLAHDYDVCMMEVIARQNGPVPEDSDPRERGFQESLAHLKETMQKALTAHDSQIDSTCFIDILKSSDFHEDVKVSDALTYFIGGFHTTGNMLTWAFYYLALYPETQEKLYQEIKTVIADDSFDPSHMNEMRYLRQVLDETLRCGVVAPFAARVQLDSEYSLCGHVMPRGTPCIQALGVGFQNENIWPNPERFDPSRFDEEKSKLRSSMAFQPFGFAGKRICPGNRLAYLEASLVVCEVVRRFKVNLVEGQEVTPNFDLVSRPEEEIWVTLNVR